MKTKKRLWLPQLRWPNPERLEQALQAFALQGWNLDSMAPQSSLRLTLLRTDPRSFRFALDFCPRPSVSYRNRWELAGWERIASLGKYPLWRAPADNQTAAPRDDAALAERCRKLRGSARACMWIFLVALALLLAGSIMLLAQHRPLQVLRLLLEALAVGLLCAYLGWAARQLSNRPKK